MANLKESLNKISQLDGFMGACVVDSGSGMMLGAKNNDSSINLELAAAGNTKVVRSKGETMAALGLDDDIQDILITLGKQYHLIRLIAERDGLFIYLVLDKKGGNLAMARYVLSEAEKNLIL